MKFELLTLLIEKWDEENISFDDVDPITLLHSLMGERILKAKRPRRNSWCEQGPRFRYS